ncbi:MAG TPA: hypothetical protein VK145_02640 [Candidatus Nanoarchaeia archaeon]|nr:hypothetical protein [Candidatus Nanoarchaeia archaeon]
MNNALCKTGRDMGTGFVSRTRGLNPKFADSNAAKFANKENEEDELGTSSSEASNSSDDSASSDDDGKPGREGGKDAKAKSKQMMAKKKRADSDEDDAGGAADDEEEDMDPIETILGKKGISKEEKFKQLLNIAVPLDRGHLKMEKVGTTLH